MDKSILGGNVVLLFSIYDRDGIQSQEYAFLEYTEMALLIDTVEVTVLFVRARWSPDDEVDQILRRRTKLAEKRALNGEECFGMEHLQNLHAYINLLRAEHEFAQFPERIPWALRRF